MNTHDGAVRELSAHELDLVGGGVGGGAFRLTITPEKSTLTASSVSDGASGGIVSGGGGSGLGGLVDGLVGGLVRGLL